MEKILKSPLAFVQTALQDKKGLRYYFIAVGVLLVSGIGLLIWMKLQPETHLPAAYAAKKPAPTKKYYSPLSGAEVSDETLTKRPVTAIMIENSPDARPQSGLKDAGVVY